MKTRLRGDCHCGAIGAVLSSDKPIGELPLRACDCAFCRKHGARTTCDPDARVRFLVRDAGSMSKYRFASGATSFVVCRRCGVYVGACAEIYGEHRATVNVNSMGASFAAREATTVSYDGESPDSRMARRARNWARCDVVFVRASALEGEHARALLDAYFVEMGTRLGGFDPARSVSANAEEVAPPRGVFLVLSDDRVGLACGGLKTLEPGVGEIKRMYVDKKARGRGLGRDLLDELERAARGMGLHRVVLDTAAPLDEANALYRSAGFVEVPAYNDNPYATRWFAKRLTE